MHLTPQKQIKTKKFGERFLPNRVTTNFDNVLEKLQTEKLP
jgi:hypothetical protein